MRPLLRLTEWALAAVFLASLGPGTARAGWTRDEFTFNGKPVIEHVCVPAAATVPTPAVILLHGAGPRGSTDGAMEKICEELAAAGYYTEYIEYYSQTDDVRPSARR